MPTFRCRQLVTFQSDDIHTITVDDESGRVVSIGEDAAANVVDLGDVVVLPPLVNTHTHLEFSDIETPLGERGNSLPSWIQQVVAKRRTTTDAAEQTGDLRASAIRAGLAQSTDACVSVVGDIVTEPWNGQWTPSNGAPPGVAFLERLSLDESRLLELMEVAREHLMTAAPWHAGLSPHAPYSTHPMLVEQLCELSQATQAPIAMHLAESIEELELLRSGGGEFRQMLEGFGAWRDGIFTEPRRPLHYLQLLAKAHRALVIHGNYLDAEERQFAADYGLTVVYCPRTHYFFDHHPYPLADLLQRGVRVALGTDSRASSPDLGLWKEFQFAAARHPDVAPESILRCATLHGGAALGFPFRWEGAAASDLVVASLDGCSGDNVYEQLVQSNHLRRLSQLA